jgi:hypothetical protein
LLNASGFGRDTLTGKPDFELYDMENDPFEMNNVAVENPAVVTELKTEYVKWFKDVSHTRENNYDPPRIYIGSTNENPVVLTRQDWRSEQSWGEDEANGYWILKVVQAGSYQVLARIQDHQESGVAILSFGKQNIQLSLAQNQREIVFDRIELDKGEMELQMNFELNTKTIGPWQVEVRKVL